VNTTVLKAIPLSMAVQIGLVQKIRRHIFHTFSIRKHLLSHQPDMGKQVFLLIFCYKFILALIA